MKRVHDKQPWHGLPLQCGLLVLLGGLFAAPMPAAEVGDKLWISGHLNAAVAWRDSVLEGGESTAREFSLGIPDDGTFRYRTLALQLRYQLRTESEIIVQLSHERNGDSIVDDLRDEIEMDWAFLRHSWASGSTLRLGRFPVPFGIFNEIRDVGTLLPTYRPASAVYLEGTFTSETIDGLGFFSRLGADRDWQLTLDLYGGESQTLEAAPFDRTDLKEVRLKDYVGLQAWLQTPLEGLRLGMAAQSKELSGGQVGVLREPGGRTKVEDFLLSVDADFDRFFARAEYRWIRPEPNPNFFGAPVELSFDRWYAQLGWRIQERWTLVAQFETAINGFESSVLTRSIKGSGFEDLALVISHAFSHSLVLKAEFHHLDENRFAFRPTFGPGGIRVEPSRVNLGSGSYGLLSLAVSF